MVSRERNVHMRWPNEEVVEFYRREAQPLQLPWQPGQLPAIQVEPQFVATRWRRLRWNCPNEWREQK